MSGAVEASTVRRPRGRPRATFDIARARELRAAGGSWCVVAREVGVSIRTLRRKIFATAPGAQAGHS